MRKLSIMAGILVLAVELTAWSSCGDALAQTTRATPAGPAGRAAPASRAIRAPPPNTRRFLPPRQKQRIREFRPWLHSNGHLRRRHRGERSTGGQTDRVAGA